MRAIRSRRGSRRRRCSTRPIATGLDEPDAPGFDLSEEAAVAAVRRLLGPSPVSVDDLARVADLDVRSVRMAIVVLDLAGRIEHSGGDRVAWLAEP